MLDSEVNIKNITLATMLTIITSVQSPRLEYICHYLFEYLTHTKYVISNQVKNESDFIIQYGGETNESVFFIPENGLLSNDARQPEQVKKFISQSGIEAIFPSEQKVVYGLDFDVFSAIFYYLSGVEELVIKPTDKHGRISYYETSIHKNNWVTTPQVDVWVDLLFEKIGINSKLEYKGVFTSDIDNAYAYKGKSFAKNFLGSMKSLLKLDFSRGMNRLSFLFGIAKDPYDTYALQNSIMPETLECYYFILVGQDTVYDNPIDIQNPEMLELLKRLKTKGVLGIHPSYSVEDNLSKFKDEVSRLKNNIGVEVNTSRYHFLRLNRQMYYSMLVKAGFEHDYTLAFHDYLGFRALTCRPFYFYDIQKEKREELLLHSTCFMDVTGQRYMPHTLEKIEEEVIKLIQKIKQYRGEAIILIHNEAFSDKFEWKGWRKIFKKIISSM